MDKSAKGESKFQCIHYYNSQKQQVQAIMLFNTFQLEISFKHNTLSNCLLIK